MQAHWLVAQSIAQPKPSNKLASPNTRTDENKTRNGNKAIYASRGIHSILRVLYFPKPCFQADKSIAGLKPRPGAYSRDGSRNDLQKKPCTEKRVEDFDEAKGIKWLLWATIAFLALVSMFISGQFVFLLYVASTLVLYIFNYPSKRKVLKEMDINGDDDQAAVS